MINEAKIPLYDMVLSLSNAMDWLNPALVEHHNMVAYTAYQIAVELGLPDDLQSELVLAGALHDSGALSLQTRMDAIEFEAPEETGDIQEHADLGFRLLKDFEPFTNAALIIRYHHLPWQDYLKNASETAVPVGAHILHLADRIAVLVDRNREILGQVPEIVARIEARSGTAFGPQFVEAFKRLTPKEYFWFDMVSPSVGAILSRSARLPRVELVPDELLKLAKLFAHIIDFRSPFTATHSSGVAASAEALAHLMGFSERECQMMHIAGYLHDLGKIAVPNEILEKPGPLTLDEVRTVRCHTYHIFRVLEPIADLKTVNEWASFHHEYLNGRGYPFKHKAGDLSLGSRVMAVADVLTAVTEQRPYRDGMAREGALECMKDMAESNALDARVLSALMANFDDVNTIRRRAQLAAIGEYQTFRGDAAPGAWEPQ